MCLFIQHHHFASVSAFHSFFFVIDFKILVLVNALNIIIFNSSFLFSQLSGFSPQSCQSKRNAQGICGQVDYLDFGPFYFDLKPFEKKRLQLKARLFETRNRYFKPTPLEWKFWSQFSNEFSAAKHAKRWRRLSQNRTVYESCKVTDQICLVLQLCDVVRSHEENVVQCRRKRWEDIHFVRLRQRQQGLFEL